MLSLEEAPPRRPARPRQLLALAAAALVLVAILIPLSRLFSDAPRTDVTFTNPTHWTIDVDQMLEGDRSRVDLGSIGAEQTATFDQIATPDDDRWTFEFSAWGHTGRVTLTDEDLRQAGYRVRVPDSLIRDLERDNPPASPFR